MTWAKLDDQYFRHPKSRAAGRDGRALDLAAICYCSSALTDGFVSDAALPLIAAEAEVKASVARKLVDVGRWDAVDGGYRVHNYEKRQRTREQVEAERGSVRRRVAMHRDPELRHRVRARDGDRCRYCGKRVDWNDRRSPTGGTYDHVDPKGDNSEANLVVACRGCNARKCDRTPAQAGMTLHDPGTDLGQTQIPTKNGSGQSKSKRQTEHGFLEGSPPNGTDASKNPAALSKAKAALGHTGGQP